MLLSDPLLLLSFLSRSLISLEAAAAFISAMARLSFRELRSKFNPLELNFRSLLLLRDISVFGLWERADTEDISTVW